MKNFMDQDFLLNTATAKRLYHDYAENLPIIDYHCHLAPKEIYEDKHYSNITQVWLAKDHYKWRQMRWNGVEEKYITGDANDYDKFLKYAETLEVAIGNPLYHWSHLELKKYFQYDGVLNRHTAPMVWELCNKKLQDGFGAREMIRQSNVEVICTTDDPIDSLEWHRRIMTDHFTTSVLPTWRPDRVVNIQKEDYTDYLKQLEEVSGIAVTGYATLMDALRNRMDFFHANGCFISDHGLDYIMYEAFDDTVIEEIFRKRMKGEKLSIQEIRQYKTAILLALGAEYKKRNWVMQLHYGVQRDLNQAIYQEIGADAGIDAIDNYTSASEFGQFLNALEVNGQLPKSIIYSLNPTDNAIIGTVIGCFQDSSTVAKLQHGAAWWFNDHKSGMQEQMTSLANLGLLGNFIGMLTDSRSFLSYTRHEYFRRIMCNMLGEWVENGEYPQDFMTLERIVKGISYYNAKRYFDLL